MISALVSSLSGCLPSIIGRVVPDTQLLIYLLAGGCAVLASLAILIYVFAVRNASRVALKVTELETRLEQAHESLSTERAAFVASERRLEDLGSDCRELREQQAGLTARSAAELRAAEEKINLLKTAREDMKAEFNALANRIFEEKSDRLIKNNKSSMEETLGPLRTQLSDFRKKVEGVYDSETRDRVSLRTELEHLKKLNLQMSEDAVNLTRALKGDKKTQGNWGEVVLERVLEQSGLRKGVEYETQVSLQAEDGSRRLPDVIIRLPDQKDVVVDSKVSLVDYEQYINAETDIQRDLFLKRHVNAVANHIAALSVKSYEKLEGIRSLDFVLLFIPIESAFMAAFDADPAMFKKSYDKHVIVVSPTTLLATLRTIQTLWRYEHQNSNAEKIASQAGGIFDQFCLVLQSLDEVGRNLDKARDSFDQTHKRLSSGRGNLVRRVQQLQELGARTSKTLPDSVSAALEESEALVISDDNILLQEDT